MAGGATTGDSSVVEDAGGKTAYAMADTAIFSCGDVGGVFAQGKCAVMTGGTSTCYTVMTEDGWEKRRC